MNYEKLGYHALALGMEFIMEYSDALLSQPIIEVTDVETIKKFKKILLRDIRNLEKVMEDNAGY